MLRNELLVNRMLDPSRNSPQSQPARAGDRLYERSCVSQNPAERTPEPLRAVCPYHSDHVDYSNDRPAYEMGRRGSFHAVPQLTQGINARSRMDGDGATRISVHPRAVLNFLPGVDDCPCP